MDEMARTNDDLMKHSQYLEQEQLLFKESIVELKNEVLDLRRVMPKSALLKYEKELNKSPKDLTVPGTKKGSCTIA